MKTLDELNQTRSAIEAQLARDRADLENNMAALRQSLTADQVIGDVLDYAQHNLTPHLRAVEGAVRANPVAAVLAGVGIVWLVFGPKSPKPAPKPSPAGTESEAAALRETAHHAANRPLALGAVGMALGAALANALPRTAFEDRLFGAERDKLAAQAEQALRQEAARAKASLDGLI